MGADLEKYRTLRKENMLVMSASIRPIRIKFFLPIFVHCIGCADAGTVSVEPTNPYTRGGVFATSLCATDGNLAPDCRPPKPEWLSANPWQDPKALAFYPSLNLSSSAEAGDQAQFRSWEREILEAYVGRTRTARYMEPCVDDYGPTAESVIVSNPGIFDTSAQISTRIVAETVNEFRTKASSSELDAFAKVEVTFKQELRQALQDTFVTAARVYYLRMEPRSLERLANDPSWSQCKGRVVTAITGTIVTSGTSHRDAVLSVDFKSLFEVIAEANAELDEATKVELSARTRSAFEKSVRLDFTVDFTSTTPIFYPYWVRLDDLPLAP